MIERAGTVVVIGGGPSLTPDQVEACRGRTRAIAVKEAARLASWAEVLYGADDFWFMQHLDEVRAFRGTVATIGDAPDRFGKENVKKALPGLKCYRNDGLEGLCEDPAGLRTGNNAGYQAINLAFHLGAKLILLLGLDMKSSASGAMHWFTRPHEYAQQHYQRIMLPHFAGLVAPLARHGVRVVNCSPDSAIGCFPKMSVQEALCLL